MKKGVFAFSSIVLAVLGLVLVKAEDALAVSIYKCDLFSDGFIDFKDLDAFSEKWLYDCTIQDCGGANLANDNNSVDFADFDLFAQYWQECLDVNLVGWWQFEEGSGDTAYDSAGGNDAELFGAPGWVSGVAGGALYFSRGSYGRVPACPALEPDYISVSAWIRPRGGRYIISNFEAADDGAFLLQLDAGGDLQSAVCIGDTLQAGTPIEIMTNQWQHAVMTYDGDRLRTYLNGRLKADDDVDDGVLAADGNRIYIANSEDLTKVFTGAIDDVRIYSRVLSGLEIAAFVGLEGQAWAPSPADGADDIGGDVVLSWSPGACAALHDVYFGTSFDDVNDANSSWPAGGPGDLQVYKGRQGPNSYDPEGLETGLDYYWRIDEVNDANICRGEVWSFRTVAGPVADFFAVPRSGWDIYYKGEFVSVSTGVITEYLWDFGDGATSTELAPNHQYASAGTYTVSLTVSGPVGTDTITKTNYITVNDFATGYGYPDYILNEPTQAVFDAALDAIESGGGGRMLFNFSNETVGVDWDPRRDFYGNNLIIDGQDKNIRFLYVGTQDCSQTENQCSFRIHGNDNIVRNLTWDRFPDGLHMRGGNRNLIENVTVNTVCEDALTFNGGGHTCNDCVIRGCSFGPSQDKTIMINRGGSARMVIDDCYSYNGNQPIRMTGSGLLVVRNCEFTGGSNNGPRFSGSGNLVIFENNFSHAAKSGVRLNSDVSAIIRNNRLENCFQYGVKIYQDNNDTWARMENNVIINNANGVFIESLGQVDLGGGLLDVHRNGLHSGPGTEAVPSAGGNILQGNTPYDLTNNSGHTVKAENNLWDHTTVGEVISNDVSGPADVDPLGSP